MLSLTDPVINTFGLLTDSIAHSSLRSRGLLFGQYLLYREWISHRGDFDPLQGLQVEKIERKRQGNNGQSLRIVVSRN